MQNGSVIRRNRKRHSVWQFRWWEKTSDGKKIYRRRQIETVDQIPDMDTARKAACLLVPDLNARSAKSRTASTTIAQLCSHFERCELCLTNTWRSYSTKNIYRVYLKRWIIPKWSEHLLSDIRTIEGESWLRSLPIARSTCAKIRNVMSVLFNHACRYEFFDGNPIRLVYGRVCVLCVAPNSVSANYLANAILATVNDNCLPGNKGRIIARQEEDCSCDIPRFS